jgi:hypothetical protein
MISMRCIRDIMKCIFIIIIHFFDVVNILVHLKKNFKFYGLFDLGHLKMHCGMEEVHVLIYTVFSQI